MFDEKLLLEMIEDFKNIKNVAEKRIIQLETLLGRSPKHQSIVNGIDDKRAEIVSKIEKMRQEALNKAQLSVSQIESMASNVRPTTLPRISAQEIISKVNFSRTPGEKND